MEIKKYIRTQYGEIFDLKTTSQHLFVIRDKSKEGKNCYVSYLWNDWENYFLIDEQNCALFSYKGAQNFISNLVSKNLNYNNLVIELHSAFKEYKQFDNLEELCDEFVYCYKGAKPELVDKEKIKTLILLGLEKYVYGAIWTNEGLIYAMRMIDIGKWELL